MGRAKRLGLPNWGGRRSGFRKAVLCHGYRPTQGWDPLGWRVSGWPKRFATRKGHVNRHGRFIPDRPPKAPTKAAP